MIKSKPFILLVQYEEAQLEVHCLHMMLAGEFIVTSGDPLFLHTFASQDIRISMDALSLIDKHGVLASTSYYQKKMILAIRHAFRDAK